MAGAIAAVIHYVKPKVSAVLGCHQNFVTGHPNPIAGGGLPNALDFHQTLVTPADGM